MVSAMLRYGVLALCASGCFLTSCGDSSDPTRDAAVGSDAPVTVQDTATHDRAAAADVLRPCDPQTHVCPTGYICFSSQVCPKGGTCGPQEGDLMCHKACDTNADCPLQAFTCQEVTLNRGDTTETVKFCK